MALFPKIERPCPYLDRLDSVMDGDFCRMCKRTVHDLTAMDEAGRAAFMAACGGDACISYTTRMSPALAAAALAASAAIVVMPSPALAQRHKARPAQVRPVPPQPLYFLAGAPLPPQRVEVVPPREPVKPVESRPPAPLATVEPRRDSR
ncbi:MAG: hypothetical protein V4574_00225 [Pseudomonadota bacterium]